MDGVQYEERLGPIQIGLRKDLVFTRQLLGGRPRYVVHDPLTFENNIFTEIEYRVLTGIVAGRSLAENFAALVAKGVLREAESAVFYRFVLTLHGVAAESLAHRRARDAVSTRPAGGPHGYANAHPQAVAGSRAACKPGKADRQPQQGRGGQSATK